MAAADPTRLGITALGQKTVYFDLSMAPGEMRTLSAILINGSAEPIAALTYASDVYTLVNGGFGVELRGHSATGTTAWLAYPTDSILLAPMKTQRRDFTISVPPDATPGDYITSLVLESRDPIPGAGGVALNQVVRHALAVAIVVPGSRNPEIHVSSAAHSVVAGRSVVAVAVENTGNAKLKPVGDLRLREASGREVSHSALPMDSFYAKTATHVEIALLERLQPGHYTALLVLTDSGTGLSVTSDPMPFDVPRLPVLSVGSTAGVPGIGASQQLLGAGLPLWLFATGISAAGVAGVLVALVVPRLWRRRAGHTDHGKSR